jgi:hypothetical protein
MFFDANDLQMAVIFVSHRWHSPSHPDPEGEQLSAVKIFLSWVKKWCDPTAFWASQVGLFQLFSRNSASTGQDILKATLAHFSSCLFPWKLQSVRWKGRRQPGRFAESRRRRLSRIGVWYDYTSTPQAPANRGQLVVALERIHELLGACNLITLRHPGDDYDARAWCAAEVAIDPDIDRTGFDRFAFAFHSQSTTRAQSGVDAVHTISSTTLAD